MIKKAMAADIAGRSEEERSRQPVLLSLENVSKRFCRDLKRSLFYGVQDIGRELIGQSQSSETLRKDEFWALRDINFELRAGDVVGMVGVNGCGKTTLMRVVAGLIKPTTGRITVRGRLAPLLALGAGFNPVLTGRENVYANMSILGLTYEEISERFDEVVDFAEIGYAIDAPVQTYSSGMVARLGFACAINTQPDILLLDEVLAVGDINFRRKCLERIFDMRSKGMSLLIVHHSPGMLMAVAQTGLYLRRGQVIQNGPIGEVIKSYEADLLEEAPSEASQSETEPAVEAEVKQRDIVVHEVLMLPTDRETLEPGCDAVIVARIHVNRPVEQINTVFIVHRKADIESVESASDEQILKMMSRREGGSLVDVAPGEYEIRLELPALGLLGGIYQVQARFLRPGREVLATRRSEPFAVSSDDPVKNSVYHQNRTWRALTAAGEPLETRSVFNPVDAADDLLAMGEGGKAS